MNTLITRPVVRRRFLALVPGVLFALSTRRGWALGAVDRGQTTHPTPRRGITAAHVLATKDIDGTAAARHAFELVRQIPQIVDGIRCHCGCAEMEGYYSLLSCFEKDGMAQHCEVCQGHAVLVYRLHRAGKTLAQIRAAVDAEYD